MSQGGIDEGVLFLRISGQEENVCFVLLPLIVRGAVVHLRCKDAIVHAPKPAGLVDALTVQRLIWNELVFGEEESWVRIGRVVGVVEFVEVNVEVVVTDECLVAVGAGDVLFGLVRGPGDFIDGVNGEALGP